MLLDRGADPNILLAGSKTWDEFFSDNDILQQLDRAGYGKRGSDPETECQIRIALRAQGQPFVPDRSASFVPDEPISSMPDRSTSPVPDRSTSSVSAPSVPIFPGSFSVSANTLTGAYTPNI
ncbi:hypothetical protein VCV18_001542 [Metarhizium anisopliae]